MNSEDAAEFESRIFDSKFDDFYFLIFHTFLIKPNDMFEMTGNVVYLYGICTLITYE